MVFKGAIKSILEELSLARPPLSKHIEMIPPVTENVFNKVYLGWETSPLRTEKSLSFEIASSSLGALIMEQTAEPRVAAYIQQ